MGYPKSYEMLLVCCILSLTALVQSKEKRLQANPIDDMVEASTSSINITFAPLHEEPLLDSDIIEEDFQFTCHKGLPLLRFTLTGVVAIVLALVGLVSNTLLFLVIFRQKYNQRTHLIVRTLAVVDSIILIFCVVSHSIRIITDCGMRWDFYKRNYQMIFAVFYPLGYCLRTLSIWLTTLLAINRWYSVSHPRSCETSSTKNSFICRLLCIICGAVLVCLPRFFEFRLTEDWHLEQTEISHNQVYTIIYKIIIFFLATYLIPMGLLMVFNTKLIFILRKGQLDSKKSKSITLSVVVIVLIFIICNISPMISHLIWSLETAFPSLEHLEDHRRPMTNVSNVLVVFYCAATFFVYYCCSKSFRKGFKNLCGGKLSSGAAVDSSQSSITNVTKASSGEKLDQDTNF